MKKTSAIINMESGVLFESRGTNYPFKLTEMSSTWISDCPLVSYGLWLTRCTEFILSLVNSYGIPGLISWQLDITIWARKWVAVENHCHGWTLKDVGSARHVMYCHVTPNESSAVMGQQAIAPQQSMLCIWKFTQSLTMYMRLCVEIYWIECWAWAEI